MSSKNSVASRMYEKAMARKRQRMIDHGWIQEEPVIPDEFLTEPPVVNEIVEDRNNRFDALFALRELRQEEEENGAYQDPQKRHEERLRQARQEAQQKERQEAEYEQQPTTLLVPVPIPPERPQIAHQATQTSEVPAISQDDLKPLYKYVHHLETKIEDQELHIDNLTDLVNKSQKQVRQMNMHFGTLQKKVEGLSDLYERIKQINLYYGKLNQKVERMGLRNGGIK